MTKNVMINSTSSSSRAKRITPSQTMAQARICLLLLHFYSNAKKFSQLLFYDVALVAEVSYFAPPEGISSPAGKM